MNIVHLLLGSNLDDRLSLLRQARENIAHKIGRILGESSIYESEPWGFQAESSFLNQVIKIETELDPLHLLICILNIERDLGRKRDNHQRYSSRLIDIDILFYNEEIINEKNLVIPHPGIPDRMFTLIPLSELNGSFIHPSIGKSISELVKECTDKMKVYPYRP